MKVATYNVNGIRAALRKNLTQWMDGVQADIYCFQEVKAEKDQFEQDWFVNNGYELIWHPAEKKGYSGVAIASRLKPKNIVYGCGIPEIDKEGRMVRADFGHFSVMSLYIPSGSSGEHRQAYKMEWLGWFRGYMDKLRSEIPNLIVCGDYNICHQPIDIHDPKSNAKSSGFTPEEREWMSGFIESGFVDSFRHMNKEPHHYTWWSLRTDARARNKGWRIDYIMASKPLENTINSSLIMPQAHHSDHCPMLTEFVF